MIRIVRIILIGFAAVGIFVGLFRVVWLDNNKAPTQQLSHPDKPWLDAPLVDQEKR